MTKNLADMLNQLPTGEQSLDGRFGVVMRKTSGMNGNESVELQGLEGNVMVYKEGSAVRGFRYEYTFSPVSHEATAQPVTFFTAADWTMDGDTAVLSVASSSPSHKAEVWLYRI